MHFWVNLFSASQMLTLTEKNAESNNFIAFASRPIEFSNFFFANEVWFKNLIRFMMCLYWCEIFRALNYRIKRKNTEIRKKNPWKSVGIFIELLFIWFLAWICFRLKHNRDAYNNSQYMWDESFFCHSICCHFPHLRTSHNSVKY